jgi:hypothetical protein
MGNKGQQFWINTLTQFFTVFTWGDGFASTLLLHKRVVVSMVLDSLPGRAAVSTLITGRGPDELDADDGSVELKLVIVIRDKSFPNWSISAAIQARYLPGAHPRGSPKRKRPSTEHEFQRAPANVQNEQPGHN